MERRALFTVLVCWLWAVSSFAQGPERLRISPLAGDLNGLPITVGQDQQFNAFLSFFPGAGLPGGEQNVTGQVSWQVSPLNIATMGTGGMIHAVSAGSAIVTAISGPNRASTNIVVLPDSLQSIAIAPLNFSVPKGISQQFATAGNYGPSGTHDVTTLATWTSSNTNVATFGAIPGLAQTVGVCNPLGSAGACPTITASITGVSPSSTTLTVTPPIVASIAVVPQNASVLPGTTNLIYKATAVFTDRSTQDVTNQATWGSSNSNLVTIGASTGIAATVQGSAGGIVTISAAFSGKTGTAKLTVPALSSILVTPANLSVPPGTTQQYAATGIYADGRTQNLTTVVTWSSDKTNVVTIGATTGLATASPNVITLTTAKITATLGSVSGNTNLTVGVGTALTACNTANTSLNISGMTYTLMNDVTAAGTCFVITNNNVTLNLNGHMVTYATATQSRPTFGVVGIGCTGDPDAQQGFCGGSFKNPTIFGPGTIVQGAGAFGSSDAIRFGSPGSGQCSGGNFHDLTTFVAHPDTSQIGNTSEKASASIHFHFCVGPLTIFNLTTHNTDGWVVNRSNIEGPDIRLEVWTGSSGGPTLFNNNFSGSGQGGIFSNEIAGASIHDNVVGASGHVVQDFAIFAWGTNDQIFNNTINCLSCRGIQIGGHNFHQPPASGQQVHDNDITVHMLRQYCGDGGGCNSTLDWGCETDGSYGIQFDDAPQNAVAFNNTVAGTVDLCGITGMRVTLIGAGNSSHDNIFNVSLNSSLAPNNPRAMAYATESNVSTATFTSTNDTFQADTYNFFVDFQGADQPQFFIKPTIIKGNNPDTNSAHPYTTFAFHNGTSTGGCATQTCSVHWYFTDPTFMNGASKLSNDMKALANFGPAEYFIQWTYTLTVTNASNVPLPGANITIKDASSNTVFSGATSGSGQISTVLTEFRFANFNPPNGCLGPPNNTTCTALSGPTKQSQSYTVSGTGPSCSVASFPVTVNATTAQTMKCQ